MERLKENALIVFYRYPELGKVKTRLAKELGDEFAFEFYSKCSSYVLEKLTSLNNIEVYIFFSDNKDISKFDNQFKFILSSQVGNSLGQKMNQAIKDVLCLGHKKVIICATDTPDLGKSNISDAFMSLEKSDFVFGPAVDGGYYLIGMKEEASFLFENMTWSHSDVLKESLSRIKRKNQSSSLLERLIDIDTKEDLLVWLSTSGDDYFKESINALYTKSF